jgi:catechol 2,3-dioxygenase-like lactoylglutathione lyase family enzyme
MINGVHAIVYSRDADADRRFLQDLLGLGHVDAGDGWLILAAPPAEIAVHPTDGPGSHELYLLCDDIDATVAELTAKGVAFAGPVKDRGWGLLTTIKLPGGGELGMYEPRHARPEAIGQSGVA